MMKRRSIYSLHSLASLSIVLGCAPDSRDLPSELEPNATAIAFIPDHSTWSEPVNLGPVVNSSGREINPSLSHDELSLYFMSNKPGSIGGNDIWVSRRATRRAPWQAPVNLGSVINSASNEGGATVSDDGHLLFFQSNRPGGHGLEDLYVSRRADTTDDFAWGTSENLGPKVNTAEGERGPDYLARGDTRDKTKHRRLGTLYFNRGALGVQGVDLYAAPISARGEIVAPAELLTELSVAGANEAGQTVRVDGREIFFWSNRPGTLGPADLWVSRRRSTRDAWSTPTNLGAPINTEFAEERPNLSRNGRILLFDSNRTDGSVGGQDIWMSTRKLGRR